MPDRLIIVNGVAGSGKTTLAGPLAREMGIPVDVAALAARIRSVLG